MKPYYRYTNTYIGGLEKYVFKWVFVEYDKQQIGNRHGRNVFQKDKVILI